MNDVDIVILSSNSRIVSVATNNQSMESWAKQKQGPALTVRRLPPLLPACPRTAAEPGRTARGHDGGWQVRQEAMPIKPKDGTTRFDDAVAALVVVF